MKKELTTILCLLLTIISVNKGYCAEIVYPKKNKVTINSPRTFFIGNENPKNILKINGNIVNIHPSGGFNYPVELSPGENIFTIESDENKQIFTITREEELNNTDSEKLVEKKFEKEIIGLTNKDNTPLRSTPSEYGINRIQHIQKGVIAHITGEYGEFYKIKLNSNDFAWINKQNIDLKDEFSNSNAKILSYEYNENKKSRVFKLKLSQKVPYALIENNGLNLKVYNIEKLNDNTYDFQINNTDILFGYRSFYTNENELIVEIKNPPKPGAKNIKITLDPGHGGDEFGAIGCLGHKEKDINLSIALKLKDKLAKNGYTVYMTRNDDKDMSLEDRVKFANEHSDIFISIHGNALPDELANTNATGIEGYYYYPQAKPLSDNILISLSKISGLNNRGSHRQSFAVVRNTQNISVLIETGFLINPDDNSKLVDSDFQDKIADGILNGIEGYLNEL